MPIARYIPRLLAFVAVLVLLAGCATGTSGAPDTSEPVDRDAGRQLFQTSCRACHSLVDAKAAGVFGPDLDQLQPDAERVRTQIDEDGGGMPASIIEGGDADLVARYVAEVAGIGAAEDEFGSRGAVKSKPKE